MFLLRVGFRALLRIVALGCFGVWLGGCTPADRADHAVDFDPDSIPDAFASPTAALMLPGTARSFQITPAGNLYDGEKVVRIAAASDGVPCGTPKRIAYLERWLPIAAWNRPNGDVQWHFEAVVSPSSRDTGLIVSLLVAARNRGTAARKISLSFELAPPDSNPPFVAWDAPETPDPPLRWGSGSDHQRVYAWAPGASGTRLDRGQLLSPGQAATFRVLFPAYPTAAAELARMARSPHFVMAEESRRYWTELLARGTRFELRDPEVEAALRAAEVVLLSCRERRASRWIPIGGPFQYRDVWLRDGARLIAALSVTGFTAEARALAESFEAYQWPQGAFVSQRGQLDGTGQALWSFEQAFLRPAQADSIAHYARLAQLAWKWLESQRAMGRLSGWRFGFMLPFADPRDAELTRAQFVGNDAWAIRGYRSTARLMRAAGMESEARSVDSTRAAYLHDFEAALKATGRPDLPPSWQGPGRDWGNLAAGWPCEALPPNDTHLGVLARRVWGSSAEGLVTYGHADSLHGYLGADLGSWALLAGRPKDADRVLDALLRWRNASGAGAELFSRNGGFGGNLPPHPTTAAALVALVRNSLLFDDDDTLCLTLGARASWWKGARVSGAPTRWGNVDLSFELREDVAAWRWTAVPVWSQLTLPPGAEVVSVSPPLILQSRTTVLAPPRTSSARVRVGPARSAS
jgi:hypothetical protein